MLSIEFKGGKMPKAKNEIEMVVPIGQIWRLEKFKTSPLQKMTSKSKMRPATAKIDAQIQNETCNCENRRSNPK